MNIYFLVVILICLRQRPSGVHQFFDSSFFMVSLDTIRLATKMHQASIHPFKSTISGRGGKHSPLYDRSHLAGPTEHLKSDCSAAGVVSVSQRTILWIFPPSMETFHTRRYRLRLHERISLPCSLNGLAG